MATGKDTASFFENGTPDQFEFCYKLYPAVLKLKAEKRNKKDLIRLDDWFQNELPKKIKSRGKDAHLEYDELVQTMKWKQSRGKFYPQLSYLVKVNTPRAVMQETKKAFRKLPNLEQAITALSNLKGVGTTMASALLAAAAPDSAPFMADECLMAIPEIEGIDYTTKEYLNFVQHIQSTVERLNTATGAGGGGKANEAEEQKPLWSPHRVELALWAHYVANELSPELLDDLPGPGSANANVANTNGAKPTALKVLEGGDDTTNDADDESLGTAGRGEANNTATESETENENTNPATTLTKVATSAGGALQDGDSNFVSNDSTSQEPNIDENTTQTTATTSTDEGEAGTPLASDSESNLDAPQIKANNGNGNEPALVAATAAAGNVVIPSLPAANNNSKTTANVALASANGNGTLNTIGGSVADSLDGENSSCLLRSSNNEDASGDDDDDEDDDDVLDDDEDDNARLADESSNNAVGGHKSVTPIINLNDGTTNNTMTTTTDNDSTLSSAGGLAIIAQKRALHCGGDVHDDANSQPDLKKIRSD